jgi:parallel beta-helix repeat protein
MRKRVAPSTRRSAWCVVPSLQVHDAKGVGILVCNNARGVIVDNEIRGNARAGVAIHSGSDPLVRANRIHGGLDSGVLVSEKVSALRPRPNAACAHARTPSGLTALLF